MSLTLTHHRETLPTSTPITGAGRDTAHAAALAELAEVRDALRHGGALLASPRMRRRYVEAVSWVGLYETTTEDVAA